MHDSADMSDEEAWFRRLPKEDSHGITLNPPGWFDRMLGVANVALLVIVAVLGIFVTVGVCYAAAR